MIAEKNYLISKLKEAGIKSQVYTSMKKLKQSNEIHIAAVLIDGETFIRSGSKRKYDQEGQRKRRIKLYDKTTKVKVVIADSDEVKVNKILENFLIKIGKGFEDNSNWIELTVGDADWVEEGDSILKAKIAVQLELTFIGGIYEDRDIKPMSIGDIN